jgi:RNA polymerase sigma factor (sigma-70 family)
MALARRLAWRPGAMTLPRDGSDARKAEFDRIFTEYSAPIFNYALRMVGDPDRAADITQDTFIKAYRKLDTLTDPSSTRSWLSRSATNTAIDEMRRLLAAEGLVR